MLKRCLLAIAIITSCIQPRAALALWGPSGIRVAENLTWVGYLHPTLIADGQGGCFVGWNSQGIRVTRFAAGGSLAPGWSAQGISMGAGGSADLSGLFANGAGGVYASMHDDIPTHGAFSIYLLRGPGMPMTSICSFCGGYGVGDGAGRIYFLWRRDSEPFWTQLWSTTWGNAVIDYESTQSETPIISIGSDGHPIVTWPGRAQKIDETGGLMWPQPAILCTTPASLTRNVSDGHGGLFAAWYDSRPNAQGLYLQRVDSTGQVPPGWDSNGNLVAFNSWQGSGLSADGFGGAFTSFTLGSLSRLKRVRADGSRYPSWPVDGVVVNSLTTGTTGDIVPDGQGGAFVVWYDYRFSQDRGQLYVQRVTADGTIAPGWPASGSPLGLSQTDQQGLVTAPDGSGGAFFAWVDFDPDYNTAAWVQHIGYDEVVSGPASVSDNAPRGALTIRPNPAPRRFELGFSSISTAPIRVDLYDVAGRLIETRRRDRVAPGRLVETFGSAAHPLAPGLYLARVTQANRAHSTKVAVIGY